MQSLTIKLQSLPTHLGEVVVQMIIADSAAVWQDMAFAINKLVRDFKEGVHCQAIYENK